MRKLLLILGIAFINNIQAADLAIPNTFTAGTTAVAAEVNANFTAVESAVDDNNTNITTNASGISTSASDIATNTANITINTSNIANIDSRVSMLEVTYLIGDIGPAGGWVFMLPVMVYTALKPRRWIRQVVHGDVLLLIFSGRKVPQLVRAQETQTISYEGVPPRE